MPPYTPDRGDFCLIQLSPQAGSEMAGDHRILVLSTAAFSTATGYVVGCPVTTKIKGSPFEVVIPPGTRMHGCVLAYEVRTMDYLARHARFIDRAPATVVRQVQAIVQAIVTDIA